MKLGLELIKYLGLFLGFFVFLLLAPIRAVFYFFYIKYPDVFRKPNNPSNHRSKVLYIQEQIRQWNKAGRPGLLCSSRPAWNKFTIRDFNTEQMNQIKVDLQDIVCINDEKSVLTVEPRMNMGALTNKLLALGWTIPIVPEFEELTVGGLICGAGLETSSHKYGLFFNSCISFEVVLPNGDCVICSKDENKDLFETIPMSYGTLGFLTAVQISLIRAKKYVELKYYPAESMIEAQALLMNSNHEFVEGLQYSPYKFVIIFGNFVNQIPPGFRVKRFTTYCSQLFHFDSEVFFDKLPGCVQYVPTRDYYHRHQRGYFWFATALWPILKNPLIRYTVGWGLPFSFPTFKFLLEKVLCFQYGSFMDNFFDLYNIFLQDYVIPIDQLPQLIEMCHEDIGIYPIWFCPVKLFSNKGTIQPRNNHETLYVDVGIYGISQKFYTRKERIVLWKKFEKWTLDVHGFIGFYTDSYLSRGEFAKMFNDSLYMKMRKKYNCDCAFPLTYDKVSIERRNPKKYQEFRKITSILEANDNEHNLIHLKKIE